MQPEFYAIPPMFQKDKQYLPPEMTNSIVNGIGIGFLSCIGIGIVKTIFQVLVLVLLRGLPNDWYCEEACQKYLSIILVII